MLLLILVIVLIIIYTKRKQEYENSDYYANTHASYGSVLHNKGARGEYYTYDKLKDVVGYKKFLFNCYIPKNNGEMTEIDVIMIHEAGIYLFESKNMSGWIFGTETQTKWTQVFAAGPNRSEKYSFFNPIMQNRIHVKWIKEYLHEFTNLPFFSYIVFGDNCELKKISLTSFEHCVIKRNELLPMISCQLSGMAPCLSCQMVDALYNRLYPLTQVDQFTKMQHVQNIQNKRNGVPPMNNCNVNNNLNNNPYCNMGNDGWSNVENNIRLCPRCNQQLVIRTATKGRNVGRKFWGCSAFPKCRYIENIP